MDRKGIESSLIRSAGYDSATKVLEVEFVPGKKVTDAWMAAGNKSIAPGPVWRYLAVPPEKFTAMMGANHYQSAGKYFLREIKPHHEAQKVEEAPVEKENEQVAAKAPANHAEAPRESKPNQKS